MKQSQLDYLETISEEIELVNVTLHKWSYGKQIFIKLNKVTKDEAWELIESRPDFTHQISTKI